MQETIFMCFRFSCFESKALVEKNTEWKVEWREIKEVAGVGGEFDEKEEN